MTSLARNEGSRTIESTNTELTQTVEEENARILQIDGHPIGRTVWHCPDALPQYNLGHEKRVVAIREALGSLQGIYLAGNYLKGRSIGDCVETGFQAAETYIAICGVKPSNRA